MSEGTGGNGSTSFLKELLVLFIGALQEHLLQSILQDLQIVVPN